MPSSLPPATHSIPNRPRQARLRLFLCLLTLSATISKAQVTPADPTTPAQPKPAQPASSQTTSIRATTIATVPVDGVQITGALDVVNGQAWIGSGSISAGAKPVLVTLPDRGLLKLCATTRVSLTADSSILTARSPAKPEIPGLLMAMDRGALEASFVTGRNSDVILTPDFRIVISGPGISLVQVRLGAKGDTCIENRGTNAPYLSVSSIFEGGVYRIQSSQRVMFQHGSLREVIDKEKESCGCPVDPSTLRNGTTRDNPFPEAQSAGMAPLPTPPPNVGPPGTVSAEATAQLGYDGNKPPAAPVTPAPAAKPEPRPGFFSRVGHFFRKIFGG